MCSTTACRVSGTGSMKNVVMGVNSLFSVCTTYDLSWCLVLCDGTAHVQVPKVIEHRVYNESGKHEEKDIADIDKRSSRVDSTCMMSAAITAVHQEFLLQSCKCKRPEQLKGPEKDTPHGSVNGLGGVRGICGMFVGPLDIEEVAEKQESTPNTSPFFWSLVQAPSPREKATPISSHHFIQGVLTGFADHRHAASKYCDHCAKFIKLGKGGLGNFEIHKRASLTSIPIGGWFCDNVCCENAGQ
ncbi:hypothetical protein B0H10DRAFT_1959142 [Mycena sp. CBHHK59/15]|nr:hypothetical protein B0H10DRAFT_1959142 [Mycena sp. CBHHK59/15]